MFYLPIYFQSIKGNTAITSGVNTLLFLAFFGVGAMLSGVRNNGMVARELPLGPAR